MLMILTLLVIVLFICCQREGFSQQWGPFPDTFKDYETNDWHKYWHESKQMRVPTKFDNYVPGAPSYSCNRCYYPMAMPFN